MEFEVEIKSHKKLSASGSERWHECPGSVALSAKCPPSKESAYSKEGTVAHTLMEKVLTDTANAFYYVGKDFGKFKITEEMATHVQAFVDEVRNIKNELGAELHVEKKIELNHIHPDVGGTADVILVQPFGEIWVIDFKYGAGVAVSATRNPQLLTYALGAVQDQDYSKVVLAIAQPRVDHEEGRFRKWECGPEEITEFAKLVRQKALETQKPNAPLKLGEWCRWCPASAICPEQHKRALEVARTDFDSPILPDVKSLTPQQISKVIEHRKLIEQWFESVEAYAHGVLMQGGSIEGVKLVAKRSERIWVDQQRATDFLSSKLGEAAFERKLLSVPKAEKLLGKNALVDLFQTLDRGTTVAPKSDRRREVENAFAAFDEIPGPGRSDSISDNDF